MGRKKLRWVVELRVDASWVADGFDLRTSEDVKEMLSRRLPYAMGHEITGRVMEAPDRQEVRRLQSGR